MVIAHHIIFGAYGFWLPNDPRGSWSEFVAAWELFRFGPATKTDERRSLAAEAHDVRLRREVKKSLKYPPVVFNGLQARAVARGFADFVQNNGLIVRACSILPEHVHIVVERYRYKAEQIANLLKGAASRKLREEAIHPLMKYPTRSGRLPKCWARRQWAVLLNGEAELISAIRYVEDNPVKEGKKQQHWRFVTPMGF
jgi:REP element-mobilizing transposase RayT